MKLKTLVVTVAVLLALSVVVYIARRPSAPAAADARVGHPVLDASLIGPAAKVILNDDGKSVELTRNPSGAWQVTNFFDLPADFQKLARLTGDLSEAKITRVVTSNPERLARLEFKGSSIELRDSANKPLWSVALGKSPETGGRFIRYGNETKAYLAALNIFLDPDPKNWADTQLLNLKPDDVSKIVIPLPGGNVTVSRASKDAPWTATPVPAGQRLASDKVNTLLTSLGGLRFSEATDPAAPDAVAAKSAERTFTLGTFDNKSYIVSLGRRPEEKKLKPPAPGTSGPAALGSSATIAESSSKAEAEKPPGAPTVNPLTPEFETVPAGPVFVSIHSSDQAAPINQIMTKRAYQIPEYTFTALPQKSEDLFEPLPAPTSAPGTTPAASAAKPAPSEAAPAGATPSTK